MEGVIERTHHVPHVRNANVAPCTAQFALFVEAPDRLDTSSDFGPADLSDDTYRAGKSTQTPQSAK